MLQTLGSAVVAAVVAAGCSGSTTTNGALDTEPTGVGTTVVDDAGDGRAGDIAVALNAVCDTWLDAVAERGPFPVDDFDPTDPDPADLPAVAEYLSDALDPLLTLQLKVGLTDVPDDDQAALDALLAALDDEEQNLRRQIDAATRRDVPGFVTTVEAVAEISARRAEAADQLGADRCGP